MRRNYSVFLISWCIIHFLSAQPASAAASIMRNTKHDLSSSSSSVIKSSLSGSDQICIFCHTPHSSTKDAPLWNRSDVYETYTVYTSDVMGALSYPAPDQPTIKLGAGSADVHVKTRVCLSCHDGTIALGHLVNLPAGISSDISMSGTTGANPANAMPPAAAGFMGLDLRDDHPVAVKYLSSGAGSDPELSATPPSALKLYPSGGSNYVECTSCHNAHDNQYGNFLVMSNRNSAICAGCHAKTGYEPSSIHASSSLAYSPTDGTPAGRLGTAVGTPDGVKCMVCHFPHKAGVVYNDPTTPNAGSGKYLLSFHEESSCFNNPNDRWSTPGASAACHGTGASLVKRNIQSETGGGGAAGKTSAHRVGAYQNIHAATEGNVKGWLGGSYVGTWHVECQDCHNPHAAGSATHAQGANTISSASTLFGAGGVILNSAPSWAVKTDGVYTYFEPLGVTTSASWPLPHYEYEICFKCHSDWAWSSNPGAIPPYSQGGNLTNQALEFGGNSTSFHPVVNATGRTTGRLNGSWDANKGTQTMYCSDCHAKEGFTAPLGPHGSNNAVILRNSFQAAYGTQGGGEAQKQPADLCVDCHAQTEYLTTADGQATSGTGFKTAGNLNLHTQHAWRAQGSVFTVLPITSPWPYRCVNCHSRVPHGYTAKAMIVLQGAGLPYEAVTGQGKITSFSPQTSYSKADCSTVAGCHQN
jgi:predicted CXXCH cytochrome family protein